jgi:elongation factor Ts
MTSKFTARFTVPTRGVDWLLPRRVFASLDLSLVKELRAMSGAPISECKRAIEATSGQVDQLSHALDWLRQHGAAKAVSKVAGRDSTEGLIGLGISPQSAVLVQVASETDFASRSAVFIDLVQQVTASVAAAATYDAVATIPVEIVLKYPVVGQLNRTIQDIMDESIVSIRENISIRSVLKTTSQNGVLVGYVHNRVSSNHSAVQVGTAASVVELVGSHDLLESIGKKLAMHVVAAKPLYLSQENVPANVVEHEKQVIVAQLENSAAASDKKKPSSPEVLEKIVQGKLRKYYESCCLLQQQHMLEENNPPIQRFLLEKQLTIPQFTLLSIH